MSTLNDYLVEKRHAMRRAKAAFASVAEARPINARVEAVGRSGVRQIRIRDFRVLSDSPPLLAGYDLGPGSPELALGVLGSCITHTALVIAAEWELSLESIATEVAADFQPNAGKAGFETVPLNPHNIRYTLVINSSEPAGRIAELHAEIERICPIYALFVAPQTINGSISLNPPKENDEASKGAWK